jgi:site-specific recombinase XerD
MPADTAIQKRDRALFAMMLLTGVRVSACISLKLKHVRQDGRGIDQDAREVRTKFGKTHSVYFFPIGDDIRQMFVEYVAYLRNELLWSEDAPLFGRTLQAVSAAHQLEPVGVAPQHWKTPRGVWDIFRNAFNLAGLPYHTPHSLRRTLARMGQRVCKTPEEMKAWSQNLGHDEVLTTLTSYGHVPDHRQAHLIAELGAGQPSVSADDLVRVLERYGLRPLDGNSTQDA